MTGRRLNWSIYLYKWSIEAGQTCPFVLEFGVYVCVDTLKGSALN